MQTELNTNFGISRYEKRDNKEIHYVKFSWNWDEKLKRGRFNSERGKVLGFADVPVLGYNNTFNYKREFVRPIALSNRVKSTFRRLKSYGFREVALVKQKFSSPKDMVAYYKDCVKSSL